MVITIYFYITCSHGQVNMLISKEKELISVFVVAVICLGKWSLCNSYVYKSLSSPCWPLNPKVIGAVTFGNSTEVCLYDCCLFYPLFQLYGILLIRNYCPSFKCWSRKHYDVQGTCVFPEILYLPTHAPYACMYACLGTKNVNHTHTGKFHTHDSQFWTTCSVAINVKNWIQFAPKINQWTVSPK